MKSIVLFGATTQLTPKHQKLDGFNYYVRAEVVETDPLKALEDAQPLNGENVLNTCEYE